MCALRALYLDAVSGPQPGSFLLRGQKKRTKEKAARMTCPANNAGFPVLLAHSGAHYNSHKKPCSNSNGLIPLWPAVLGSVIRG